MRHACWLIGSLVLTVAVASTASAQTRGSFHVSPTVGFFLFDDESITQAGGVEIEPAVIFGARFGYAFAPSWQVEAGYGFAPLSTELSMFQEGGSEEDLADLDAHLIYGAINYLLRYADNPTAFLLSAGGGVMILSPDEGDGTTNPMLELGAGFTHPLSDRIAIRGEARDHLVFCGAPEFDFESSACPSGDETLHNFEVSASLQFWFR